MTSTHDTRASSMAAAASRTVAPTGTVTGARPSRSRTSLWWIQEWAVFVATIQSALIVPSRMPSTIWS